MAYGAGSPQWLAANSFFSLPPLSVRGSKYPSVSKETVQIAAALNKAEQRSEKKLKKNLSMD